MWRLLGEQSQRVLKDGKALATEAENLAEFTSQASAFAEHRLPILRATGIA